MGYNKEEKEIETMLFKAGVLKKDSINIEFIEDIGNMFWKRLWIKWKLEEPFKDLINITYKKVKSIEPLVDKDEIKRRLIKAMKNQFENAFLNTTKKDKDMRYIG